MIFSGSDEVHVFEKEERVHSSTHAFMNKYSTFADGKLVYFTNWNTETVELNVETLEEKIVQQGFEVLSGVPTASNFVSVTIHGTVATKSLQKDLKTVFPKMVECDWRAIISLDDHHAVVSGSSGNSLLEGSKLAQDQNYFLLVALKDLEVVNRAAPLALSWLGADRSTFQSHLPLGVEFVRCMRCFRRKRLHLILALRAKSGIDLLVQFKRKLLHVQTLVQESANLDSICPDSNDSSRWLFGGMERSSYGGFIKSIRIVYK